MLLSKILMDPPQDFASSGQNGYAVVSVLVNWFWSSTPIAVFRWLPLLFPKCLQVWLSIVVLISFALEWPAYHCMNKEPTGTKNANMNGVLFCHGMRINVIVTKSLNICRFMRTISEMFLVVIFLVLNGALPSRALEWQLCVFSPGLQ